MTTRKRSNELSETHDAEACKTEWCQSGVNLSQSSANFDQVELNAPKEAATIMRLGFGKFNVTIAHPQQMTTKKSIAMNSATQAR
jgi:hypothetical protein